MLKFFCLLQLAKKVDFLIILIYYSNAMFRPGKNYRVLKKYNGKPSKRLHYLYYFITLPFCQFVSEIASWRKHSQTVLSTLFYIFAAVA